MWIKFGEDNVVNMSNIVQITSGHECINLWPVTQAGTTTRSIQVADTPETRALIDALLDISWEELRPRIKLRAAGARRV
jgi:hypothetical protein